MAEQRKPVADYYNSWKFTGKELDEETGLYYFGARYYQPSWSVWLSVDPKAHLMPAWSPYNYTMNNPINYVDPDGRSVEEPDDVIIKDKNGMEIGIWYSNILDGEIYLNTSIGDGIPSTKFLPNLSIDEYVPNKIDAIGFEIGGKIAIGSGVEGLFEYIQLENKSSAKGYKVAGLSFGFDASIGIQINFYKAKQGKRLNKFSFEGIAESVSAGYETFDLEFTNSDDFTGVGISLIKGAVPVSGSLNFQRSKLSGTEFEIGNFLGADIRNLKTGDKLININKNF
ncbi:RHS repeat-associated core domain-containing protein [Flavobacterium sp. CS20]|nr:RHS repeat-associated core domain-containing protein [Flavobacterium sp. CS20]